MALPQTVSWSFQGDAAGQKHARVETIFMDRQHRRWPSQATGLNPVLNAPCGVLVYHEIFG